MSKRRYRVNVEDRPDYFDIIEKYAERRIMGYRCLVPGCKRQISAVRDRTNRDRTNRDRTNLMDYGARPNMGNARGAMTNHLKGHMRRGEI